MSNFISQYFYDLSISPVCWAKASTKRGVACMGWLGAE